jgi:hypothetical protein
MTQERFDRTSRESSTRSSRQGTRTIPGSLVRIAERLLSWWAGPHCSRMGPSALSLAAPGLLLITMPVLAQSALLPPPAVLKKLSVEELLDIDVTSVSKKEEKLSRRDLLDNRHPEFGQPINRREIPRSILARITWYR